VAGRSAGAFIAVFPRIWSAGPARPHPSIPLRGGSGRWRPPNQALAPNPGRWQQERQQQHFPGSDPFWNLWRLAHRPAWGFGRPRCRCCAPQTLGPGPADRVAAGQAIWPCGLAGGSDVARSAASLRRLRGQPAAARFPLICSAGLYSDSADRPLRSNGARCWHGPGCPRVCGQPRGLDARALSSALEQGLTACGRQSWRLRHALSRLRPEQVSGWENIQGQGPAAGRFQLGDCPI